MVLGCRCIVLNPWENGGAKPRKCGSSVVSAVAPYLEVMASSRKFEQKFEWLGMIRYDWIFNHYQKKDRGETDHFNGVIIRTMVASSDCLVLLYRLSMGISHPEPSYIYRYSIRGTWLWRSPTAWTAIPFFCSTCSCLICYNWSFERRGRARWKYGILADGALKKRNNYKSDPERVAATAYVIGLS